MKKAGILGGMSYESTLLYYKELNRLIQNRLGGIHSAECLINSVDMGIIGEKINQNDWTGIKEYLLPMVRELENGGADFFLIATNTIHYIAPALSAEASIPLLHIADALGEEMKNQGIIKAGLLGTRATMEKDFYKEKLQKGYGIETLIPTDEEREVLNKIIFTELCSGILKPESIEQIIIITRRLIEQGACGIILGCTELPLVLKQKDFTEPLFDTLKIHVNKAAEYMLNEKNS